MTRRILIITAMILALAAAPAMAETIDFVTDPGWSSGDGQTSWSETYTIAGQGLVTVTVSGWDSGAPEALSWNNDSSGPDGFGIQPGEYDEVDGSEYLTVDFDSTVYLSSFRVSDLFTEPGDNGWSEIGFYSIDAGVTWVQFIAPLSNEPWPATNGYLELSINANVDQLMLKALDPVPDGQNHDYSLRSMEVSAAGTPEPASMLLFGSAAGALGWLRRRQTKKRG